MHAVVYVDGASRGNPGPASCAAYIMYEGSVPVKMAVYLGVTTNNVAEYCGFLLALKETLDMGCDEVVVCSDSNLCVKQINGEYKVTAQNLVPLYQRVMGMLARFKKWEVRYVPREDNAVADGLSNRVLDLRESITESITM